MLLMGVGLVFTWSLMFCLLPVLVVFCIVSCFCFCG